MPAKRKRKPTKDSRIGPTPEAQRHGIYESAGMAYRRVPVIETMTTRGQITLLQYVALDYYRNQAALADRSLLRSCLDDSVRGGDGSGHIPASLQSALLETARIERDLGSLRDIARWIALDDKSLSAWCIAKHGGRERYAGNGKFVAMVPVREAGVMREALIELRSAAGRIVR